MYKLTVLPSHIYAEATCLLPTLSPKAAPSPPYGKQASQGVTSS